VSPGRKEEEEEEAVEEVEAMEAMEAVEAVEAMEAAEGKHAAAPQLRIAGRSMRALRPADVDAGPNECA